MCVRVGPVTICYMYAQDALGVLPLLPQRLGCRNPLPLPTGNLIEEINCSQDIRFFILCLFSVKEASHEVKSKFFLFLFLTN